jgi:Phage integrase family
VARARDAIGLEDFRIHDLRRTAATRMAELGISPHTISMILNHVKRARPKRPFACRVHAAGSLVYPCRDGVGANGLKVRHGAFAKN